MEKIDCVMLAAGESSRMEKWKLMLPCRGSTIIEGSVRNALEVSSRVILVAGFRGEELARLFSRQDRVEVVFNPGYKKGMFSSIKRGASLVRSGRFFLALGDMPLVDPAVFRALLPYADIEVVIPKYKGKKGHPLLLSRKALQTIAGLEETKTMRDVLAGFPTLTVPVEDSHILHDIDDREDYRSYIEERI